MRAGELRFELRSARFWSRPFVLFLLVWTGGTVIALGAAALSGALAPELTPAFLTAGFVVNVGVALLALLARALLRPPSRPPIELREAHLALPRFPYSRRAIAIPYADVFDVRVTGSRASRRIVLGVHGRLLISFGARDFTSADGAPALARALRERIALLPDGAERLRALDRRAQVAAALRHPPILTLTLASLLALAFAAQLLRQTGAPLLDLVRMGANVPELVAAGQLFRLATANLLHAGPGHLAANLVGLLVLGALVEGVFGRPRFALIVCCAAFGGALASHLAARAEMSIGFSTGVSGLAGAIAYLNVYRREELPAALWLPAWYGLGLIALEVVFEILVPGIDHMAHVGGALAGWGASAFCLRRQSLVTARHQVSRGVLLATGIAVALFAVATGQGVVHAWSAERESELLFAERYLREPLRHLVETNNAAFVFAVTPEIERERVELALEAMEEVIADAPEVHAFWDTVATLHYRLGALEEAIAAERRAHALAPLPLYASQLARFEGARLEQAGPLRLGPHSDVTPRVWMDSAVEEEPAHRVITVELDGSFPEGGVVHVLAWRGEELLGYLELAIGPEPDPVYWLARPASPHHAYGDDVRFEVALVDTSAPGLGAPGVSWRLWVIDPRVTSLPGVLPPAGSG